MFFVDALQETMIWNLNSYATSSFKAHSLTGYVSALSGVLTGISQIPFAKIVDIWGRPQGFALTVSFLVLGMIMMATCNSVHVYAVAQTFYWMGYVLSYQISRVNFANSLWASSSENYRVTSSFSLTDPTASLEYSTP